MTRSVQDFVEKIARSTVMRSLPTGFSRTTCLCARPSRPGSDAVERIVQSACAVAARARKKNAYLKRMSRMGHISWMLVANCDYCPQLCFIRICLQQLLKTRIAPQRIPDGI